MVVTTISIKQSFHIQIPVVASWQVCDKKYIVGNGRAMVREYICCYCWVCGCRCTHYVIVDLTIIVSSGWHQLVLTRCKKCCNKVVGDVPKVVTREHLLQCG